MGFQAGYSPFRQEEDMDQLNMLAQIEARLEAIERLLKQILEVLKKQ